MLAKTVRNGHRLRYLEVLGFGCFRFLFLIIIAVLIGIHLTRMNVDCLQVYHHQLTRKIGRGVRQGQKDTPCYVR